MSFKELTISNKDKDTFDEEKYMLDKKAYLAGKKDAAEGIDRDSSRFGKNIRARDMYDMGYSSESYSGC